MEFAYGIIPLQLKEGKWLTYLVHRTRSGGFWEFPKGHAEGQETPLESAKRELEEETGMELTYVLHKDPLVASYTYEEEGREHGKQVYYYLGMVQGEPSFQSSELDDGQWVDLDKAEGVVTHESSRSICRQVIQALSTLLSG